MRFRFVGVLLLFSVLMNSTPLVASDEELGPRGMCIAALLKGGLILGLMASASAKTDVMIGEARFPWESRASVEKRNSENRAVSYLLVGGSIVSFAAAGVLAATWKESKPAGEPPNGATLIRISGVPKEAKVIVDGYRYASDGEFATIQIDGLRSREVYTREITIIVPRAEQTMVYRAKITFVGCEVLTIAMQDLQKSEI